MTDFTALLAAAEAIAEEFGCDLSRMDEAELDWYAERLTAERFDELALDMAHAAMQAY